MGGADAVDPARLEPGEDIRFSRNKYRYSKVIKWREVLPGAADLFIIREVHKFLRRSMLPKKVPWEANTSTKRG
jgi:hypothetical protein